MMRSFWRIAVLGLIFGAGISTSSAQLFPGDADGDGNLTGGDRQAITEHILGIATAAGDPDANEDGVVDVADLISISQTVLLIEEPNSARPRLTLDVSPPAIAPGQPVQISWSAEGLGLAPDARLVIRAREPGLMQPTGDGAFSTGITPGNGMPYYLANGAWTMGEMFEAHLAGNATVALPTNAEGEWEFFAVVRDGDSGPTIAAEIDRLAVSAAPSIRLALSRSAASPNDPIRATLQLSPGSAPPNIDVIAVLTLPDGSMLSLPGLSDAEYFFIENAPAAETTYVLFDRPLSEFGAGDYRVSVRLHATGTRALLGMAHADFTICDSLTQVGGTMTMFGSAMTISDPNLTELRAVSIESARTVAETTFATDGTYTMNLPPGRYVLMGAGESDMGAFTARTLVPFAVDCSGAMQTVNVLATPSETPQSGIALARKAMRTLSPPVRNQSMMGVLGPLMILNFEFAGAPDKRSAARAAFDQYVAQMRAANPGVQIVTSDELAELLQQAAEGYQYGDEGEAGQTLGGLSTTVDSTAAYSAMRIEATSSGPVSVTVNTVSTYSAEAIAGPTVKTVSDISQLSTAISEAATEQSDGLEAKIEAPIPKPVVPILELSIESDTHPLINAVLDRRLILQDGENVSLTFKARLLEGADDPPTPAANFPVSIEYRLPPAFGDWTGFGDDPQMTNFNGEVSRTVEINNPGNGLGFFRASFTKEGAEQPYNEPWFAFQFTVRPDLADPKRWLFVSDVPGKWNLKPGETTTYSVNIVTDPSIPPQAYTVGLNSNHGGGSPGMITPNEVTVVTTQLSPGSSPIGRADFQFTAPSTRGITDIFGSWQNPPDCPGCPPVVEQSLRVWIDGGGSMIISAGDGGGTTPPPNRTEKNAAAQGIITSPSNVTADLRVAGDPVPNLPVTFSIDGDGTLGVQHTQTGPLGRASTIFNPPIGMSGTAVVTASALIDGETITENVTLNYEGRGYYQITDLGPSPGITLDGMGLNNHAHIVAGPQLWRPGFGWSTLPALEGDFMRRAFDINDAGTIVGQAFRTYVYEEGGTDMQMEPVRWVNGQIQRLAQVTEDDSSYVLSINAAATSINSSGRMAGHTSVLVFQTEDGTNRSYATAATVWNGLTPVQLPSLTASPVCYANDINDAGVVVGRRTSPAFRAMKWVPGGATTPLTGFMDGYSEAFAVNDQGHIVGASFAPGSSVVPAIWLPAPAYGLPAGVHSLGNIPGFTFTIAEAINHSGQVVGTAAPGPPPRAFFWENGAIYDLNNLIDPNSIYYLRRGLAINDPGQILCEAIIGGDASNPVLVLLTPPETAAPGAGQDGNSAANKIETVHKNTQTAGAEPANANTGSVITAPTSVTADLRVAGDPVPNLPVSFSIDGDGTLGVQHTQTGPLGRASTIFNPPIGMSGTSTVTATAMIDGELIVENIDINYEGQPYYAIVDLGLPDPQVQNDAGLNNLGDVVTSRYLLQTGQITSVLPPFHDDELRYALAINDAGVIVGRGRRVSDQVVEPPGEAPFNPQLTDPVRWVNGSIQSLGHIRQDRFAGAGNGSFATAINASGAIVGVSELLIDEQDPDTPRDDIVQFTATLWSGGNANSLKPAGTISSEALDINDAGVIVGKSTSQSAGINYRRANKWGTGGGSGSFLQDFGYPRAEARAINNHGQIVGSADQTGVGSPPVIWLTAPAYGLPAGINRLYNAGTVSGMANDINDSGEVVGMLLFPSTQGFLWKNGSIFDLNELIDPSSIYTIQRALRINGNGQILCLARIDSTMNFTLLLLTPQSGGGGA